jgi:hypothetical protein
LKTKNGNFPLNSLDNFNSAILWLSEETRFRPTEQEGVPRLKDLSESPRTQDKGVIFFQAVVRDAKRRSRFFSSRSTQSWRTFIRETAAEAWTSSGTFSRKRDRKK